MPIWATPCPIWPSSAAPVPHSAVDAAVPAGLLPQASSSWRGRPALRGHRIADGVPGYDFSVLLRVAEVTAGAVGTSAVIVQADADAGIRVSSALTLHDGGLLELRHTVTNTGTSPYQLDELATVLPVAPDAVELLDLTGRWCRERHPQRRAIEQGTWVRTGRHGRTGHDASLLFAAGTAGFGNRHGRVWATHLAWSGNHEQFADSAADGRTMIGGSELLGPAEVVLAPGGSYTTPALFAAYSDRGLDGISESFYAWFRNRPHHVLPAAAAAGLSRTGQRGAGKPRPVVLNTWEAVYFDHNLTTLIELADSAAELGVERFVLDDGWFRGRRDDHAGLGDWYVDEIPVALRAHPADRRRHLPRDGIRAVGGAGDGQPGLRRRPGTSGVDRRPVGPELQGRRAAAAGMAPPAHH